jgi:hypothetical protein
MSRPRTALVALISLYALVCAAAPASAQPAMAEFARGAQIQLSGRGPVVRLLLPEAVYTTVARPDLADIRVFNRTGDAVPHALRHAPAPEAAVATFIGVPFFPLRRETPEESLLTQVAVGASGAIVEVRGGTPARDEIVGYLLDATSVTVPVDRLSLEWQAPEGATFLARVNVDASDDLTLWRTVASGVAIARLQHGDRQLTQSDVDLSGAARYLRISWPGELAAINLTSTRLRPRSARPAPEVTWTTRAGQLRQGLAEYDTGGRLPIEYVDIEFADDTDVASVVVRSRPDPEAEWRHVYDGAFFSAMRDGTRVRNQPASVRLTSDRYWQVEAARPGGWAPGRTPRLRLGWHAHELLFVPKGEPPFTLAFGSVRAGNAAAPIDALLAGLGTPDALARPEPATLAEIRDLAGTSVLAPARPIRRIVLWSVLVAAVLALAALVARAAREMNRV